MGVTIDLFSTKRVYRGTVVQKVFELIHDERSWTATAQIPATRRVKNGEFIGFWCVDDRYRLFEVTDVKHDEQNSTAAITAVDAAIGDLQGRIVKRVMLEDAGIGDAVNAVMDGLGWSVNIQTGTTDTEEVKAYYKPAWDALSGIADAYNVRIVPHYNIENGVLTGKTLDVTDKTSEYRGRLVEQGHDASSVTVQYIGANRPMIYALGATTGSGDPPERVTIEDVVWSVANGDPVDKPKGQSWVAVPEALESLPDGEERGQTAEWPGITDAGKLMQRAWEKAQKAAVPEMAANAQISDMEMIAGQKWKAMRMWDRACVKPKNGQETMLQITGIKRNYVRPRLTKITLGTDEETGMDDLVRQVAALSRTSLQTSATVRSHGVGISKNLTHLEDLDIQVDENKTTIGKVVIDLDAANARIDLMATREELTEVDRSLTAVSVKLDAVEGEVELKAYTSYVNEIEERVETAEAEISVNADEIELRVKAGDIASAINQTAQEVKIYASKIDLDGFVTTRELESELASFKSSWAESMTVTSLKVTEGASIKELEVGSHALKTHSARYVTSVTFPKLQTRKLYYIDSNGDGQSMDVVTGYSESGSASRDSTYTYWTTQ